MTQHTWTLEKFRRSGRSHLEGARYVLNHVQDVRPGQPMLMPLSAAYLAHVALECIMKARLLYRNGCASTEDLQRKYPKVYAALFQGKRGHDLDFLSESLRLPELMKLEGKTWVDDDCWKRIASTERPYSLRYGAEDVEASKVEQELQRAAEISTALLSSTKTIARRRTKKRGGR